MVLVGNMSNREAIEFRLATEADLLELRSLYAETVDELGPTAYTPAQVAAWKASMMSAGIRPRVDTL